MDDLEGEVLSGVSDETKGSLDVYLGEVGVSIDTRPLAHLGYKPSQVNLAIEGALNKYSQNGIAVSQYTNVATFKLAVEDLSEEEVSAFGEGVTVEITVFEEGGEELENLTISSFIFNSDIKTLLIETEKPKIDVPLALDPDIPYHIKLDGPLNSFLSAVNPIIEDDYPKTGNIWYDSYKINNANQKFFFKKLEDGTYEITTQSGYILGMEWIPFYGAVYFLYDRASVELFIDFGIGYYGGGAPAINFELEQTGAGLVKIRTKTVNEYMSSEQIYTGIVYLPWLANTGIVQDQAEFSILAATVVWTFEEIGTEYSAAIIPPSEQDFAFEQTIFNCASSSFETTVGVTKTEVTTTTISLSEEMSIYGSQTDSESATVEAEASGQVFGIGVSVSASGTLESSTTSGFGQNKGKTLADEQTKETTVSVERTINVLPYSAVEAFDVVQTIPYVKIPYVQRYLLKGSDGQTVLSGDEILSQLDANQFEGVVTEIGDDFVKFSVKGEVNVQNYVKFINQVDDIDGACN